MLHRVVFKNRQLCRELARLTDQRLPPDGDGASPSSSWDVVITAMEVNDKHGTGALVSRIFQCCTNIFSIRSRNDYGGEHTFGDVNVCLSSTNLSRPDVFQEVSFVLDGKAVRRVVCIPYLRQDLLAAIATSELYKAPLCTYIMDDQNVCCDHIPDDLMREFLAKCSLRLTTHPEMRNAYEHKYGFKFWLLPAVVPGHLIQTAVKVPARDLPEAPRGALVGSIWMEKWFEQIQNTVKESGCRIDWYGNDKPYFPIDVDDLNQAGITAFGIFPEEALAERLRDYPYAVVPTGTFDDTGNALALAKLSLPGRILFILATSHTPVIVLGDPETPAARFVNRFRIGVVSDYSAKSFRKAVQDVLSPEVQLSMRQNAAGIAQSLSARGIGEWLWQSLEKGEPQDQRFESMLPRLKSDMVAFIEPPVPADVFREHITIYEVMRRLRNNGLKPDFVVDVGASTGIWSKSLGRLFRNARFILVDPLTSRYDPAFRESTVETVPQCELVEVALSNQAGTAQFQVPSDLYGGSLLQAPEYRSCDIVQIKVKTLDQLAKEKNICGRGVLKMDVQMAEHLVLEGAREFLAQIDVLIVELSLARFHPQAKLLHEMMAYINSLGFRYYDDGGCWRSPVDGTLMQKDLVFLKEGLFEYGASS